jgi:hypothetical protein
METSRFFGKTGKGREAANGSLPRGRDGEAVETALPEPAAAAGQAKAGPDAAERLGRGNGSRGAPVAGLT